jgi:hypothetical protein
VNNRSSGGKVGTAGVETLGSADIVPGTRSPLELATAVGSNAITLPAAAVGPGVGLGLEPARVAIPATETIATRAAAATNHRRRS